MAVLRAWRGASQENMPHAAHVIGPEGMIELTAGVPYQSARACAQGLVLESEVWRRVRGRA